MIEKHDEQSTFIVCGGKIKGFPWGYYMWTRGDEIKYSAAKSILELDYSLNEDGSDLLTIKSPMLSREEGIRHLFSSRVGGVSTAEFESMNLSFTRGDQDERVYENYRRIASKLGRTVEDYTLTYQTHTNHVRIVTEEDRGKGVSRKRDYTDVDALITDVPGIVLGVFWADCVPILLYDPKRKVIAAVHAGWRGTVTNIASECVQKMQEHFSSNPRDILASIGPSICKSCYEVSKDVAEKFRERFPDKEEIVGLGRQILNDENVLVEQKYQLDLWQANREILLEAGLDESHIELGNTCTCCNPTLFFSHRYQGERRGNNAAFISM